MMLPTSSRRMPATPSNGATVLEVDADDRFRDHAANCRRVQCRDIANPGQHDRKVLLLDCCSDDGNGGRGPRRRSAGALREMLSSHVTPETTAIIMRPTSRGGRRPLFTAGLLETTNGAVMASTG